MTPLATGLLAAGGALVVLKMGKAKPASESKGAAGSTDTELTTAKPALQNPPDPIKVAGATGQAPAGTPAPTPTAPATVSSPLKSVSSPTTVKAGSTTCTTCPSTPTSGFPSTLELNRVMSLAAQSTRIVY